jgi:hypothetical protein
MYVWHVLVTCAECHAPIKSPRHGRLQFSGGCRGDADVLSNTHTLNQGNAGARPALALSHYSSLSLAFPPGCVLCTSVVGQQSTGSLNAGFGRGPCPCFLLTNIGIARLQDIFLLNDCAGCGGDLLLGTRDVLMELITLLLLPEIAHQVCSQSTGCDLLLCIAHVLVWWLCRVGSLLPEGACRPGGTTP